MAATARPDRAAGADTDGAGRGVRRLGAYESARYYTHRLSLLNRLIARTTKDMLAERFGMSQMEWRILVQLEFRSPSKVADIHARSLVQKSQISSALPQLVRRGCVVRQDDPDDARAPWFAITDEGLRRYRDVIRVSRKRQRGLELLLSPRERAGFEQAVDRLIEFFLDENRGEGMFATPDGPRAAPHRRGKVTR
jgi:DNA-binding MarR family transcriptional regulator